MSNPASIRADLAAALERAEQARKSPLGGTEWAFGYLGSAVEQAIAALDRHQSKEGLPREAEGAGLQPALHGVHSVPDSEAAALCDALVGEPCDSATARAYR